MLSKKLLDYPRSDSTELAEVVPNGVTPILYWIVQVKPREYIASHRTPNKLKIDTNRTMSFLLFKA